MSQRGFIDRAGFEHIVINNMNTPAIREETVFEVNMNAVLIYDTIDFAAMAKIMLERVAHATEETMQLERQALARGHSETAAGRRDGADRGDGCPPDPAGLAPGSVSCLLAH